MESSRAFLITQKSCCGEKCVNCPYIPKRMKGSTKVDKDFGNCPICGRPMNKKNSNLHHLIPKLKGGKTDDKNMVRLHTVCHGKIHSIWSESELRDSYNTIEAIMMDERIQKFAKFISKQPTNVDMKNKMVKNHKRRRR